jgi:hypothetical protein
MRAKASLLDFAECSLFSHLFAKIVPMRAKASLLDFAECSLFSHLFAKIMII